jgi:hypothetical protein
VVGRAPPTLGLICKILTMTPYKCLESKEERHILGWQGVLGVSMKTPLFTCAILAGALCVQVFAQTRFGRGDPNAGPPNPTPTPHPPTGMNPSGSQSTIFVTGKVVLDDGTELTEPAMIQTICRGQRRTETYSDSRGGFSFQFGDSNTGTADAISDASSSNIGTPAIMQTRRNPRDCQLQAVLAGFTSQAMELGSRGGLVDNIEVGKVPLHRLERVEGTTISVTNALAPAAARKALEKARGYETKGKWEEARKLLDKAVEIYPRYAAAWNELGRLHLRDRDAPSARRSFEQALAADPKYVNPYDGLAQLAVLSHDWRSAIEVTNKLFALDPIDFPAAYFYNAAGNYYLGDLDAAEKNALQGVRVDEGHQVPKLQCLLGMILLRKKDYQAASEHMQRYLQMATQPADVDVARKFLADIERLSDSVKPPSVEK